MSLDINYGNLPKQQGYIVDIEKLDFDAYKLHPDEDFPSPRAVRVFGGNDFHIGWNRECEPGTIIPWHIHSPSQYQVAIVLKGRIKWSYKDNEGEEHSVEFGADELAYLPPGAHNQVEVVGDEPADFIFIEKETGVPRLEHLVGDSESTYDPWNDPVWGLWLDTYRGKVWDIDENAVREY